MADSNSKLARPIIEAAVRLFKKNGFAAVSVNDICVEAGIARSSFYRVFSGKKEIISAILQDARSIQNATVEEFLDSENDFERMWALCARFLTIVLDFGPELTGSLLSMELSEPIGIVDILHGMDPWLIKLTRNAQKAGIILNPDAPEILAPMVTDLMYQVAYDWCRSKGRYPLRRKARTLAEVAFYVAPAYRWVPEELGD
ncbi:MAG: TetR/AcrR family transcriptional regulator; helix-turn-helix transcriptional regulator [Oscillospiraceae bacterium]|nr:TetR/AcrR family transcriptional regulator; helix-turn-helix transcriptional regulator [Oscillospiraceae bacterium]